MCDLSMIDYHPTENIRQVTLRREKLLGFKLASIRNAKERCHKVTEVTRNLPADLAGLKPGDIILKRIINFYIFSSFIMKFSNTWLSLFKEINGINIEAESQKQVLEKIKKFPLWIPMVVKSTSESFSSKKYSQF